MSKMRGNKTWWKVTLGPGLLGEKGNIISPRLEYGEGEGDQASIFGSRVRTNLIDE